MGVLDVLLEGFDEGAHPRGWNGRWIRGRGGKPGRLEGTYNGVKLERGVAYQGRLATGEIHTGLWNGKLTGGGVDDPNAHPEFRHVDTGAVRTFQGGVFFGRLKDVGTVETVKHRVASVREDPAGRLVSVKLRASRTNPLDEMVNFGGIPTRKGDVISTLQREGHPQAYIDRYMQGIDLARRRGLSEAADSMAKASTPEPFSRSKTSNWVARAGGLPAYIQHIAHDIMEKRGKSESSAIAIAIGVVKRWARGGGNVDAGTRAAAAKAVAEWEAMKGRNAAKGAGKLAEARPLLADEFAVRDAALARVAVLEQQIGAEALGGLLAEGLLSEAAAGSWQPQLTRVASASSEVERHEVRDASGQHVGTVSRRRSYARGEPDRFAAHTINGERVGDLGGSQPMALDAIRKHLEEAPARVGKHSSGKWLVARPASYSGQDTYTAFPSQSAARFAAGLPEKPSEPERGSQVQALAEMLRFDLMTLSGLSIPPLAAVQEARRADPFELLEAFHADELRDFRGRWRGGGARLVPRGITPGRSRPRVQTRADARYEGGVVRASAKARAAHAAKPQISLEDLPGSVGSGKWSAGAARVAKLLQGQRAMGADELAREVKAGRAIDSEHAHRARNADGSLGAYSAERRALHERIIENLLQGKREHAGNAKAIFTAGGPASGKSGLEKFGMVTLPNDVVHANPDIVREMLPEYQALMKAGRAAEASTLVHEEASHLAKVVTKIALGRQHHVLVDTVGDSGPGKFAGKIRQAQASGHQVSVHYATTDVGTALERANKRKRKVPEQYLRDAHAEVSRRFVEEISKIRGIHLQVVDTTNRPNVVIAERGRKPGDNLVIRNGELFRKFLAKGRA